MSYAAAAFALFAAYEQLSLSTSRKEGEYDDDANIASSTINGQKVCRKGNVIADNHDPGRIDISLRFTI
jgi:hypothetical protein